MQLANRAGRETMEASDLFSAILEESSGGVASIIRRYGVEPTLLVRRITARIQDDELCEEELRKRFELPPHLKQLATNLNLLVRLDKVAAGLWPRQGDSAGPRDPLSPRTVELRHADR